MKNISICFYVLLILFIPKILLPCTQRVTGKAKIESIEYSSSEIDDMKKDALKVFLDCQSCDIAYIMEGIPFVNFLRNRQEADVHILITIQETGSGGRKYSINFIGQNVFEDTQDIMQYTAQPTETGDDIRRGLLQVLKLGLMPFVKNTPIADKISIRLIEEVVPTSVADKWDSWVFNIGMNGSTTGEKTTQISWLSGNLSINRVTTESKLRMNVVAGFNENKYKFEDETFISTSRRKSFRSLYVESLGDHWSMGVMANVSSSSYNNIKLGFYGGWGVEYSVFPYSESSRREMSLRYEIGYEYSHYREETIFDKLSDNLFLNSLVTTINFNQPWGDLYLLLEESLYFHDSSKNRFSLDGGISVNLIKGLSFDVSGGYSQIHDQLSLPKRGATYEEILLRRLELATNYYYYISLGFSYTFGSIYSNVVNPRFGR